MKEVKQQQYALLENMTHLSKIPILTQWKILHFPLIL